MRRKQFVKDYLTFSKKDRIGVLSIIGLILTIYFIPKFFTRSSDSSFIKPDPAIQIAVDTLQQRTSKKYPEQNERNYVSDYQYEPTENASFEKGALFNFDPNTLPAEGWRKLGLNERVARTINNYRNKGGKFYKPEDLQKIWGLPNGFYERVKDYIQITSVAPRNYNNEPYKHIDYAEEKKARLTIADINTADTSALIALPGIGSRLAYRITNFRDKLGGFHSVEQIGETYGLPDSTFQKIKPYLHINADGVRKININTATKDELKAHPYIRWNLANAIVEYRNQHGSFKSLEELKNIALVDEAIFSKVVPYFSL